MIRAPRIAFRKITIDLAGGYCILQVHRYRPQEGKPMVEQTKELPKPEIVTYRREELDLPVVLTGTPPPSGTPI